MSRIQEWTGIPGPFLNTRSIEEHPYGTTPARRDAREGQSGPGEIGAVFRAPAPNPRQGRLDKRGVHPTPATALTIFHLLPVGDITGLVTEDRDHTLHADRSPAEKPESDGARRRTWLRCRRSAFSHGGYRRDLPAARRGLPATPGRLRSAAGQLRSAGRLRSAAGIPAAAAGLGPARRPAAEEELARLDGLDVTASVEDVTDSPNHALAMIKIKTSTGETDNFTLSMEEGDNGWCAKGA